MLSATAMDDADAIAGAEFGCPGHRHQEITVSLPAVLREEPVDQETWISRCLKFYNQTLANCPITAVSRE